MKKYKYRVTTVYYCNMQPTEVEEVYWELDDPQSRYIQEAEWWTSVAEIVS